MEKSSEIMNRQNEKGFTLLETVFVLSIFLLIASFSLLLLRPQQSYLERELFFSHLKADIFYAQHCALTSQRPILFNFDPENNHYYIKNHTGEILLERHYPEDIKIYEGSLKLYLQFNANGNISKFGSIYINIENVRYRLTFLIGRGRFYVVKD